MTKIEFVLYDGDIPEQLKALVGLTVEAAVISSDGLVAIQLGNQVLIVTSLLGTTEYIPLQFEIGILKPGAQPLTNAPDCREIPQLIGATFTGLEETVLSFGTIGLRFGDGEVVLCKRPVN